MKPAIQIMAPCYCFHVERNKNPFMIYFVTSICETHFKETIVKSKHIIHTN